MQKKKSIQNFRKKVQKKFQQIKVPKKYNKISENKTKKCPKTCPKKAKKITKKNTQKIQ